MRLITDYSGQRGQGSLSQILKVRQDSIKTSVSNTETNLAASGVELWNLAQINAALFRLYSLTSQRLDHNVCGVVSSGRHCRTVNGCTPSSAGNLPSSTPGRSRPMPMEWAPASLPHGFRFASRDGELVRLRSFFRFDDDDDDTNERSTVVPTVDSATAKTRLEVLKGWEVNFAVLCLYAASAVALLYLLVVLRHVNAVWQETHQLAALSTFERALRALLEAGSVALPILFALRVAAHGRVTDEQVWTGVLLAVGLLASNPLTRAFVNVRHHGIHPPFQLSSFNKSEFVARGQPAVPIGAAVSHSSQDVYATLVLDDAVYTAIIYLYLLLSAHSYRVLDNSRIHSVSFYAPKLTAVLTYFAVKILTGFRAGVSLGLVPYARVFTWILLARSGRHSLRVTIPVIITTALDTAFGFWLVREVALTAAFLARTPYLEHRTKQLGFRCFVFQSLVFCGNIIALAILVTVLLPREMLYESFDYPASTFVQLEPPVGRLGLALVYFTWTLVLAYVNLPPGPLVPFTAQAVEHLLRLVRNSRVAMWVGLADISSAEDAEDSSDDDEPGPSTAIQHGSRGAIASTAPNAAPVASIEDAVLVRVPLRYRHRVWMSPGGWGTPFAYRSMSPLPFSSFWPDDRRGLSQERQSVRFPSPQPSSSAYPTSEDAELMKEVRPSSSSLPIPTAQSWSNPDALAAYGPVYGASSRMDEPEQNGTFSIARTGCSSTSRDGDSRLTHRLPPQLPGRLRLRKNMFVMETQVLLANASFLAYIPGNPAEERQNFPRTGEGAASGPKGASETPSTSLLFTGSLADDLNELAAQMEEEKRRFESQQAASSPQHLVTSPGAIDPNRQPSCDDGTMFLVNPYEMAERHGFRLHRYFCNKELNTHAVVLVDSCHVIVSFSGSRDVKTVGVNSNFNRAVLDEKLARFEYEFSQAYEDGCSDDGDVAAGVDVEDLDEPSVFSGAGGETRFDWRSSRNGYGNRGSRRREAGGNVLRRAKSEESIRYFLDRAEEDEPLPMPVGGGKNRTQYGTMTSRPSAGTLYRSATFDERRRPYRGGRNWPSAQEGVGMVASTLAQELMTFGQAKVHEGFLTAYMSLRKQVMGALVELYGGRDAGEEAQFDGQVPNRERGTNCSHAAGNAELSSSSDRPLFLCGHSLGTRLFLTLYLYIFRWWWRNVRLGHSLNLILVACLWFFLCCGFFLSRRRCNGNVL